ncbi:ThiF family adenylyltransferase [Pseudomonas sp. 22526]|uniref:ThiF family adenylyltransferase n=1 Tax=Pseudomonas sp. 22526 TaxID=3453937 RepID=UPI003F84365C
MNLPQLQATVVAVPIHAHRVAMHRGTRQGDASLILDDPDGWKYIALHLMNGQNDLAWIAQQLDTQGHPAQYDDLLALVEDLRVQNLLQDRSFFQPQQLRPDQTDRYSRNLNGFAALARDGRTPAELQTRLLEGHVLMLGCGGLGSCTATALTMAGCGTITLVDFDEIELGNLNRQLFTVQDIGLKKVDGLKARLSAINPDVRVNTVFERLTGTEAVTRLIDEFKPDILVAAIDRPVIAADRWISDACFARGVPAVFNSVSAGMGMLWTKFPGQSGCFRCDEKWSQEHNPDHHATRQYREQHDLIPATSAFSHCAMTVGGMMSADIVRHLVGWPMSSAGKLVTIDFATLQTTIIDKPQHPACTVCSA